MKTTVARLLPFVWIALIFVLSSQPTPRFAQGDLMDAAIKKGGHFLLFLVLGSSLAVAISTTRLVRWALPLAFAASIAFAMSDEFHQLFTPTRSPGWTDVFIDGLGAIVGVALVALWQRRPTQRDSRR